MAAYPQTIGITDEQSRKQVHLQGNNVNVSKVQKGDI